MAEPDISISGKVHVPDKLTVLVDPEQPDLDIVFVHGFTGSPRKTWAREATERPSKVRKTNLFTKSPHQEKPVNDVYWPQDLLPHTVPNARILTYGYDTRIRHRLSSPISTNMVYDIAGDFLVALEAKRRPDASRQVLFVAHSLGGIVVKEMLRQSNVCQLSKTHLHGIFESTIGVIFFGTPHGGADPRGLLHHIAEAFIKLVGFNVNRDIVNALLPSSERLKELRDEFHPVAAAREWIIHSFQEQYAVKLLGRKVVEDESSSLGNLPHEIKERIASDHREMCRFSGPDDPEYKKVAAALDRIITNVSKQSSVEDCSFLSEDQRKVLLESLKFDQIDVRRMNIRKAHSKTCKWLLDEPRYRSWLNSQQFAEHHGFFWIKGNPGTGKSTLIKYALAETWERVKKRKKGMEGMIVLEFFFNARGDNLEKSVEGMYRSLLWLLFVKVPELQAAFDSLEARSLRFKDQHEWSVEALKDLLEYSVQNLRHYRITCFIDALDECDEKQIEDMVAHFERLGEIALESSTHFYVCFSSRHFPDIKINKGLGLVLENQEGHRLDIENYVNSVLKVDPGPLAEEIREDLLKKASGIFLWVVLVVKILNDESKSGDVLELKERLRDIPAGLHELFKDILTRGDDNRDKLLMCIQLVLFAKRPLTPEELHYAILSGIGPNPAIQERSEYITAEVTRRYILEHSKGFVEATRSEIPTVQFIHESVRDFLLKKNGIRELWPDDQINFKAQSHERLKRCCFVYINNDTMDDTTSGSSLSKASLEKIVNLQRSASSKFPFIGYAVQHVLYHADVAESEGISEGDFINNFPRQSWVNLHNLFEKYATRRYTPSASLWYIFAEHNLANLLRSLIRSYPEKDLIFTATKERYGPPILAALATGSQDAVCAILKTEVDKSPPDHALHDLYIRCCQDPDRRMKYGRDFKCREDRTVLSFAIENDDTTLFACLLKMRKIDVDYEDRLGATLLYMAVLHGREAMVRLLLEEGANPDSQNKKGATPLSLAARKGDNIFFEMFYSKAKAHTHARNSGNDILLLEAAWGGHEDIVKFLLDKADPSSKDLRGCTPLSLAARNGHKTIVQLLLSKKVDPDSRDENGSTPLSLAIEEGHKEIVELLLSTKKVDPRSRDVRGATPLFRAVGRGDKALVELLLSKKVDPNSRNMYGDTPLSLAVEKRHKEIVELLLSTEKVDPDSRDKNGRSPLWWAAHLGRKEIVELLLSTEKVDPDSRDKDGTSSLWWAAHYGHKEIVELLLSTEKVNVDSPDNHGNSLFEWALGGRRVKTTVGSAPVLERVFNTGFDGLSSSTTICPCTREEIQRLEEIRDLLEEYQTRMGTMKVGE